MYTNQYITDYPQYNQQHEQFPSNYYQWFKYGQQPVYNTPPPTQTAATFIRPTVPVQQPQEPTPGQHVASLWMGGVEPYMTKNFITRAFQKMGAYPMDVKLKPNKNRGETIGYAFVDFYDPVYVIHKLNGRFIPGTNPPVKFKLNHAGSLGKISTSESFSVWIGELSYDVDDFQLYKTFARRYKSIRRAEVVFDCSGHSKGYGFISFDSEEEQKHCLKNMNGFPGLGSKRIKVKNVIPKSESHMFV